MLGTTQNTFKRLPCPERDLPELYAWTGKPPVPGSPGWARTGGGPSALPARRNPTSGSTGCSFSRFRARMQSRRSAQYSRTSAWSEGRPPGEIAAGAMHKNCASPPIFTLNGRNGGFFRSGKTSLRRSPGRFAVQAFQLRESAGSGAKERAAKQIPGAGPEEAGTPAAAGAALPGSMP